MPRITHKGRELARKLNPSLGTTTAIEETCSLICRHARTYAALQEAACNRELCAEEQKQEQRIEARLTALCLELPTVEGKAITPIFSGDPRGATVKLRMPAGRYDCWGGEGLCVPGA